VLSFKYPLEFRPRFTNVNLASTLLSIISISIIVFRIFQLLNYTVRALMLVLKWVEIRGSSSRMRKSHY